ncbi:hypothetical protein P7K49_025563 [Saguinus oedipus]|uniref:Uncharacterized protein n=1 Tax=Saguinus oedipus TaxID=9490 RepID=A0ABQ9UHH9_SAGOE|nr:hypothetical protein P7K49_025563 [Saguinus oedipus]
MSIKRQQRRARETFQSPVAKLFRGHQTLGHSRPGSGGGTRTHTRTPRPRAAPQHSIPRVACCRRYRFLTCVRALGPRCLCRRALRSRRETLLNLTRRVRKALASFPFVLRPLQPTQRLPRTCGRSCSG